MPFGHGRPRRGVRADHSSSPLRHIEPSPRVRVACILYASGQARSKREAATLAGVNHYYFNMLTNQSEPTKRLISSVQEMIEDETITTSQLLQRLSRKAIGKIAQLMDTGSEQTQLKAAQDLADRNPESSRTSKLQVDGGLTIATADAQALAAAMVESARDADRYAAVASEGLTEIDTDVIPVAQLGPGQMNTHEEEKDDE